MHLTICRVQQSFRGVLPWCKGGVLPWCKGPLVGQPAWFGLWVCSTFELLWSRATPFCWSRCCEARYQLLAIEYRLVERHAIGLDAVGILVWFSSVKTMKFLVLAPPKRMVGEGLFGDLGPWDSCPPQSRSADQSVVSRIHQYCLAIESVTEVVDLGSVLEDHILNQVANWDWMEVTLDLPGKCAKLCELLAFLSVTAGSFIALNDGEVWARRGSKP